MTGEAHCGVDFCERCGDCLACYGGENCWEGGIDNGSHIWPAVLENDDDETWMEAVFHDR
jgi:hypothetical protein